MKRKLISVAGRTLLVSIPHKWAKAQKLSKGIEVDVEEQGSRLVIQGQGQPKEKNTAIDLSNVSERVVGWLISTLHKKGYDNIEIRFQDSRQLTEKLPLLDSLVKNLMLGFIIAEQKERSITLRRISHEITEEFQKSLRRAFILTLNFGEEIEKRIQHHSKGSYGDLLNLEKTNNQLTNFCERLLNTYNIYELDEVHFWYVICWNLEKVCDIPKYIVELLEQKEKINQDDQIHNVLHFFNEYLREIYELFYDFNLQKLEESQRKRRQFMKDYDKLMTETEYPSITGILFAGITQTADFVPSLFALKGAGRME